MKKVLIIEDNPMSAAINKDYLERLGNIEAIGPVTTLKETLEIIEEQEISLVLIDIYLPNTTGIEILRSLRERKCLVDAIMITAANNSDEIQEAFAYGIIDYLVKPFSFGRFKDAVMKHEFKHEVFTQKEVLQQSDIDGTYKGKKTTSSKLPKGLDHRTLSKVIYTLEHTEQKDWSLKEIANYIGVSNVTIKKYMDYLEEVQKVEVSINRGSIGRPEFRYCLSN